MEGGIVMENIYDVAHYFLHIESMSHKKLQKLCYYAQAWHLANYGAGLVPNRFEAWVHGPVSPDLYYVYKDWGWEDIPQYRETIEFDDDQTAPFLDDVYEVYGGYTADELESLTHRELPWKNARHNIPSGAYSRNPISLNDMREYYKERISDS